MIGNKAKAVAIAPALVLAYIDEQKKVPRDIIVAGMEYAIHFQVKDRDGFPELKERGYTEYSDDSPYDLGPLRSFLEGAEVANGIVLFPEDKRLVNGIIETPRFLQGMSSVEVYITEFANGDRLDKI